MPLASIAGAHSRLRMSSSASSPPRGEVNSRGASSRGGSSSSAASARRLSGTCRRAPLVLPNSTISAQHAAARHRRRRVARCERCGRTWQLDGPQRWQRAARRSRGGPASHCRRTPPRSRRHRSSARNRRCPADSRHRGSRRTAAQRLPWWCGRSWHHDNPHCPSGTAAASFSFRAWRSTRKGHERLASRTPRDVVAPVADRLTSSSTPRTVAIVNWGWTKSPPVMERTLADDLKWALFVLIGATLGYLVFGGGETSLLVGSVAGVVLVIVVLNILRRLRRPS